VAARRCSTCGINYPAPYSIYQSKSLCPLHDEPMEYFGDIEPDEDWEESAKEIADRIVMNLEDGELIPDLEPEAVFTEGGRTFVYSWDVIQRGVSHRLPDGALLRVKDTVYEVLGYVDAMRAYWVTTFDMHLTDEQLADLATPPKKKRTKK
jgi:hypothetical protein